MKKFLIALLVVLVLVGCILFFLLALLIVVPSRTIKAQVEQTLPPPVAEPVAEVAQLVTNEIEEALPPFVAQAILPPVELDQVDFLRPTVVDADYQQFVANNEIARGDITQAKVALTFDCEGNGDNMQEILDILDDYQLKGTFFLEGQFARNYPHMIERLLEYGHEVANHSLSHKDFKQLNRDEAHVEVEELEKLVSNAARRPIPMRFFRFPLGSRDQQQLDWISELGYHSVFWSVDPMGWRSDATPQQVAETIISESEHGAIILMHCHPQADRGALSIVIEELQKRGFAIESVSKILGPEQLFP